MIGNTLAILTYPKKPHTTVIPHFGIICGLDNEDKLQLIDT